MKSIAKMIDHTLLRADARNEEIQALCKEALDAGFYSVCVNSYFVGLVAKCLENSDVKVCSVVGFPLGSMSTAAKAFECADAIQNGADEIDMVINLASLKSGDDDACRLDIQAVVEAAQGRPVKVILECCLLTPEEIERACRLAEEAGAKFVKTSTGFSTSGATVADVQRMRASVSSQVEVKASGGIRSYADAQAMIAAGASRIGCSAGLAILAEESKQA
ncbi:MAG: deoxyribose-phosphate aldolase [Eubacteriales bacterium]|nr:deoxyribose-phosphate aldolase [Eubacteriales bacterium]